MFCYILPPPQTFSIKYHDKYKVFERLPAKKDEDRRFLPNGLSVLPHENINNVN